MVERTINQDIIDSVNKFIEEIKKKYNVTAIILFGSYAKGTENEDSDIDIAVISDDFENRATSNNNRRLRKSFKSFCKRGCRYWNKSSIK